MIVGFTGTRAGMTEAQKKVVARLLEEHKPSEVHHGDCIGADAQFHQIAGNIPIVGHPASEVGEQRAFCLNFSRIHESKPPLERNRDIVTASDIMIATPKESREVLRCQSFNAVRGAIASQRDRVRLWAEPIIGAGAMVSSL